MPIESGLCSVQHDLKEMGKQSRRKARRNRRLRAQQRASKSISVKLWRMIRPKLTVKRVIEIAIALIGVVSAYIGILGFWMPRISVQPLEAMNPRDATSSEFTVTNQGAMDIYQVAIGCRFVNFYVRAYEPGSVAIRRREGNEVKEPEIGDISEMVPVNNFYPSIPPMRSGTMKFPFSMAGEEDLDVEIIVHYRPAWYPFDRQESFRFITKAAADGRIHWLPRPDTAPDIFAPVSPKK